MKNLLAIGSIAVMLAGCVMAEKTSSVSVEKTDNILVLDNGDVRVRYDVLKQTYSAGDGGQWYLTHGRFPGQREDLSARVVTVSDTLGQGMAIEVRRPSGRIHTLALYEGVPFLCLKTSVENADTQSALHHDLVPLIAGLDVGIPADELRAFGCEGSQTLDEPRISYSFLSVAKPDTRAGVVCGFLTHQRGSGIVTVKTEDGGVQIEGRVQYGKLNVPAGEEIDGETLAIGYFDDGLLGLEAYADAIAKAHEIELPPVPSGYCTWYHARASDEQRTAELAEFSAEQLRDYGFDFIQIDDFWQISTESEKRDFTTHKPDGPYPSGMRHTAENINEYGMLAGLWLIPFAWNPQAPALVDHPDWFIHTPAGDINKVTWAGYCLDCTNPDTQDFVRDVISRITKEWGYKYLKLDGLWSGIGTKLLYPTPDYRPDELGEAILHDPDKTQIQAYRMGLELVRDAAGDDVFLLGCNIAQNMRSMGASFGLLDGMRIGRDVGAKWDNIVPCAELASHLYFFHGRVWYNDPDCLMLREPLTLDQARAWGSLIGISGQMNVVSEWLPGLPEERLDVVKRTLPNHGGCGRPVDLFESGIPQVWYLPMGNGNLKRHIVGLFNWDEKTESDVNFSLESASSPRSNSERYVGFDYWEDRFVPPFSGSVDLTLRPSSCRILSLQEVSDHPQLVSTSRHITQGGVDVIALDWDGRNRVLSGTSKVIGGDPYELRIATPETGSVWRVKSVAVSVADRRKEVAIRFNQDGAYARVPILSPETRRVSWRVEF